MNTNTEIQALLNQLLELDECNLKQKIKGLSTENKQAIIEAMGLPKRCSQKRLVAEILETQMFIRITRKYTRNI